MKLWERIKYKLLKKSEFLIFSPFFIKNFDLPLNNQSSKPISVAIPHYNRGKKIHITLKNILKDNRFDEIVILDDGSSPEEFDSLKENLSRFTGKIKLFRRDKNIGSFGTKVQVVSLCSNEWVILLDSDNSLFKEYIDAIFNIPNWKDDTIYCSDFAYPSFDFRALSGEIIDFEKCSHMDWRLFGIFINDGNFLLNKNKYLQALLPYKAFIPFGACSLFTNYIWLSSGNKLKIMPNSAYYHRVQSDSIWMNTKDESLKKSDLFGDMLINGIKADQDYLSKLLDVLPDAWIEPTFIPLTNTEI
ncbi:glycosyltransferase family 2 protein [Calothrix sp. FACHB-156]|nr:glycosyltransferase family 2 protein [Nostoc linckia FACHB-104]MBD2335798.1 glycosyltransferase family 2 protein [Calothrix sp. FACHB-156]